jgi:hypothetical protein
MGKIVGIDLGPLFSSLAMLNTIGKPRSFRMRRRPTDPVGHLFDETTEALSASESRPSTRGTSTPHAPFAGSNVTWRPRFQSPHRRQRLDGYGTVGVDPQEAPADCSAQVGEIRDAVISCPRISTRSDARRP